MAKKEKRQTEAKKVVDEEVQVGENRTVKKVLAILLTIIIAIVLCFEFYFAVMLAVPFISTALFSFISMSNPESDFAYMMMWEMPCMFLIVFGAIAEWKLVVFVVKKLARMCKNAFRKEHIEDECKSESEVG